MKQISLLIITFLALNANATKYYVNDASTSDDVYCTAIGNAANNGLTPAAPKLTLTSILTTYAVSFAAGDTIFIDAGNYTEINLSSPINGIVIKGAGLVKTFITKSGSDRYFMLINDNNTVLSDMKLSGYDNQTTSGVQALGIAANTTGVKIINVQVDGCATTSTGGGYPIEVASGASVLFDGGGLTCNSWDAGGGIQISGATTNVNIKNYQFVGNYQLSNNGTALKINNGVVNIYNTRFESNTIGGDLSGVGIDVALGTVNVYDSYFYKNQTNILSNNIGGAVSVHGGTFRITRSIFSGNIPQSATSGIYGAAIGVTGGTVTIDSCGFTGNVGARANDVYVKGGAVQTRNCTFASAANQIGIAGGTYSITTCGTPSEYGAGIVHINTNVPSYTANPALPDYLPITCVAVPCTTPTITSSAPTNTLCSGTSFSTSLSATTNSSQTTYSWTSAAVVGITGHSTSGTGNINETLFNTTASNLAVVYSVTPIFNTTCSGAAVVYTVTVYPKATVSVNSSTICAGSTTTLTPSNGSLYTLTPGNLTGTSFTLSPASTTNYTVTSTSASGCTLISATATITVNSIPTITLGSVSNSTLCSGNSSVIIPSGALTYTIQPLNTNGTSFTVNPTSSTTYSISGTSAAGCLSNAILSVPITVNTPPTISIASVSNSTLCSGNSSVITPTGASTYTLLPDNVSGTSFTVTPSATTNYTIAGTSTAGCVAANTVTTSIGVSITPTVSFASISSSTLCVGDSVVLTPSGAATYTLNPGNLSATSFTLYPNGSTTYTLSGTSAAGCIAANNDTANITVYPVPDIAIQSISKHIICSGDSSVIIPHGAASYTINPGGLTGTSFTVSPMVPTTYSLTGSNVFGCISSQQLTFTINVNPTPTVSAVSVDSQTICAGDTTQTINFTSNPNGANFSWINSNNNTGIPSSGTGSVPSYTTAIVTSVQTSTISVVPELNGCLGDTQFVLVRVNDLPLVNGATVTDASCGQQNGCVKFSGKRWIA